MDIFPVAVATVSFSAASYSIEENGGTITVSVIRGGDTERLAVVLVAADVFQGSASGTMCCIWEGLGHASPGKIDFLGVFLRCSG